MNYNMKNMLILLVLLVQLVNTKGSPTGQILKFPETSDNPESIQQKYFGSATQNYSTENNFYKDLELIPQNENKPEVDRNLKTRDSGSDEEISHIFKSMFDYPEGSNRVSRSLVDGRVNALAESGRVKSSRAKGDSVVQQQSNFEARRPSSIRMRKVSKHLYSATNPRKFKSRSKNIRRRVVDGDHMVKTDEVINEILDMLEPNVGMGTSQTLLYNSFDDSTNSLMVTQTAVGEEHKSKLKDSKITRLKETANFDEKISKKDIPKEQKDQRHSSKVLQKVRITDEYRMNQKDIVMEPLLQSHKVKTPGEFATTPFGIPTSSNVFLSTQSKSEISTRRTYYEPSRISSSIDPRKIFPGTSNVGIFDHAKHSQDKVNGTRQNLKYSPDLAKSSTEPSAKANSTKKDDALVIVLRLSEMMLREISNHVSYGLEPSDQEMKPILGEIFPSVVTSEIMVGNRKIKDVGGNLPTIPSDYITTELPAVHSIHSKNFTPENKTSNGTITFGNSSELVNEMSSNNQMPESTSSVIKTRDLEMENNTNNLEPKGHSPVTVTTEIFHSTTEDNFKRDLFDALMKEVDSFQDFPTTSKVQKDINGTQSDSSMTNTNLFDERGERQASPYQAYITQFKTLMLGLIKKFEDRINAKPNMSNSEKDLAKQYMKSLLRALVSKNMHELVKEIHRMVINKPKRDAPNNSGGI